MSDPDGHLKANVERFRGSLEQYDRYRPAPPAIIWEFASQFAALDKVLLVVDLGCGTGLSTRYWSDKADRVVGIDPSFEMLSVASAKAPANTNFQQGFSHQTGLETACADVISCCQSLHWMKPDATIAEVARLLRPGGVWITADYDLPVIHWEIDAAIQHCVRKAKEKSTELGLHREEREWTADHAAKMKASGCFRVVRECSVHAKDRGDAGRLLGFMQSLASIRMPLEKCGATEIGLDDLSLAAERVMHAGSVEWLWSYRVILALK